ncbi:anti-repressor SinI family protein [Bacillus sp. JJ1533]
MILEKNNTINLDSEWIKLLFEAKKLGLTIDEVQAFLQGKVQS